MTQFSSKLSGNNTLPPSQFSKSLFPSFPVFQSCASPCTTNMTTPTLSGGRRYFNRSWFTGFVDTFRDEKFGRRFQISSHNTIELLRRVVGVVTASSQHAVAMLKVEAKCRRAQKFVTLFGATDDHFPRKAGTKQLCLALRAFMALQSYAVGDTCVA